MARYIVEKTPTEIVKQTIDFNPDLPTGMTLLTADVTATSSDGTSTPSVITGIAAVGNILGFTLTAGTAGEDYQVKAQITCTPTAFVIEHFVELRVRTFPYLQ